MIKSFRCKYTENLFGRQFPRKWSDDVCRVALRKLLIIHACTELESLRVPPSNRLEKLKGDRGGQYSIRVNQKWRICFSWKGGDAFDVEIVDYH